MRVHLQEDVVRSSTVFFHMNSRCDDEDDDDDGHIPISHAVESL